MKNIEAFKNNSFQISEMKPYVSDLLRPKHWLYWTDFLISVSIAWGLFFIVELDSKTFFVRLIAFLISSIFFYRALLFIHEISHRRRSDLSNFSVIWNILIGIPALFPSFMYRNVHNDHHKRNNYGTQNDGEYISFGIESPWKIIFYILQSLILPLLLVIRFLIVTPLSIVHPKIRRFVMENMSSLSIDFSVKRKIPTESLEIQHWNAQEFLCFSHLALLAILYFKNIISNTTFIHIYALMVFLFTINSLRTLVAHRYNNAGAVMSFNDQMIDSINIDGPILLTEIWAPVGLRYHALHHLFPTMPYHNLYEAHRRLVKILPANSPYHQTIEHSLWTALNKLWKHAKLTTKLEINTGTYTSSKVGTQSRNKI